MRTSFRTAMIVVISHAFLYPWSYKGAYSRQPDQTTAIRLMAVISGELILESELLPLVDGELRVLRTQEYEIMSRALDQLINQRLLESEANRKGVDRERLLDQEVNSQLVEPTETDIIAYYEKLGGRKPPVDAIRTQIWKAIREERLSQAREAFFAHLRKKAGVKILLRPPRWDIGYDPDRVSGNRNAPVTMIEFSDFQCPYCRKVYPVLKNLLAKYSGQVKLAYRDFPLKQMHPQAQAAAEAARCAGEQESFWEYHDLLFSSSPLQETTELLEHSRTLRLDEKLFEACLASGKFKTRIEEDVTGGTDAGISGTPAIFINGILVKGAQPASVYEKIIESELAEQQDRSQRAH